MSKFKVGDYILFTEGQINLVGEILRIENGGDLAVKFNTRNNNIFHDLQGLCERGYGYWVNPKDAKKVVADTKINKALYPDYKQKDGFLIER
jgi:hypothetical protein